MFDERVEIQKVFDRTRAFKINKVNQTRLIHFLKHIKAVQNMVFTKNNRFKMDEETDI